MEFARNEFELTAPQGDGASLRIHLQRLFVNTGVLPEQLQGRECPPQCAHLWDVFRTLGRGHSSSGAGGSGLAPLTQTEVQAWQANHRTRLSSWEVDTLFALDNLAAQARARHTQQPQ